MPFGKFYPAKSEIITTMHGEKVPLDTPPGYGGLFWGRVYDSDGSRLRPASNYFWDLAETNGKGYEAVYWEVIDELIHQHCLKYVHPYCGDEHHYQSGFGGDESDGLIDFWVKELIPEMPDMPFEIEGKTYTIKWEYSSGSMDEDDD